LQMESDSKPLSPGWQQQQQQQQRQLPKQLQ